jgi:hypothetical protein
LLGNVQALELSVPVSLVMARQSMPKALSSLPSAQRSHTSELSRYPELVQFSSERVQRVQSSELEFGELGSCWKIEWNSLRRRSEELMATEARGML